MKNYSRAYTLTCSTSSSLPEETAETGMGAKGLSGEGYEGHYFWDTEMYVLPVLIFTEPETARKLLDYRYATLPQARDRARILRSHERCTLSVENDQW